MVKCCTVIVDDTVAEVVESQESLENFNGCESWAEASTFLSSIIIL